MDDTTREGLERLIAIADEQSWRYGLGKTAEEAFLKEEISISHHSYGERLAPLPEEFGLLTNLRTLKIAGKFGEIGSALSLRGLKDLTLDEQNLTLPGNWEALAGLQDLEKLTLDSCILPYADGVPEEGRDWKSPRQIPDTISRLTNLRELAIPGSRVDVLSPELGSMTNLEVLDLGSKGSGNSSQSTFTELPSTIGQLSCLRVLNLSGTRLTSVPPEVGQLGALEELGLSGIETLESLPEELCNLGALRSLRIGTHKSEISALPESLGDLGSLEDLEVNLPKMTTLPASITRCRSLKRLQIYGGVTALPSDIGGLASLTKFDMARNDLTAIPPTIGQCVGLEVLNLHSNALTEVPPELGDLAALTTLDLGSNELTAVPDSICQLGALEELKLASNELSAVPENIGDLRNLKLLNLSYNALTSLPDTLGTCANLEQLQARDNELTAIPETLAGLECLKELNFSSNQIQEIPEGVVNLTTRDGFELNVEDNPIKTLKWGARCLEAIGQGDEEALREALDAGVKPNASLGAALDWTNWASGDVGPRLLFLAAISGAAEGMVSILLEAGADPKQPWTYATDWDPEDCYLDTDTVSVLKSLEALATGEKDYFKVLFDDGTVGRDGLDEIKSLGYFDGDGAPTYEAPTEATLALMRAHIEA